MLKIKDVILPKKKKFREDFWHLQPNDDTLKIYDPYARFSVLPGKETFSGSHGKKICLSIGRRYNEQKATAFFNSKSKLKERIAKSLSKESGLTMDDVLKRAKDGTLKNVLIDIWGKSARKLGIPVIILQKKRGFEIYEMIKTDDVGDIAQIVYGSLVALGRAINLFADKKDEELIYWKVHLKKKLDGFLDMGFNR